MVDKKKIQKDQARLLRVHGIGYKKIASITGLDRETVRYVCRDIVAPENEGVADRMANGEACLYCGAPIDQPSGPGRRRRFCCEQCRRQYWKLHRHEQGKRPEVHHIQVCAYCGKTFEVYGKIRRKYCCHDHYLQHRNGCNLPESKLENRADFLRYMRESLLAIVEKPSEHGTERRGSSSDNQEFAQRQENNCHSSGA